MPFAESRASRALHNLQLGYKVFHAGEPHFLVLELLAVRLGFIAFEVSSAICASDRPGFKFRLCLLLAVNGGMLQNRICFIGLL